MAKTIKQFRYGTGGYDNPPDDNRRALFANGKAFFGNDDDIGHIIKIKIQGVPGTRFYLNNSCYPVMIGAEGIYELDYDGIIITTLKFDGTSLNTYDQSFSVQPLIIDAIYDDGKDD